MRNLEVVTTWHGSYKEFKCIVNHHAMNELAQYEAIIEAFTRRANKERARIELEAMKLKTPAQALSEGVL